MFMCRPIIEAAQTDGQWLSLLVEEERTLTVFHDAIDAFNDADDRLDAARLALMEEWNRRWDEESGKPWKFIEAGPDDAQREERVQAGIRAYNACKRKLQEERDGIEDKLREEKACLDAADEQYNLACDAHIRALNAVIAYPSRDPAIIKEKLRRALHHGFDDRETLLKLQASIQIDGGDAA